MNFCANQIAARIEAAPGWRVLAYQDDGAGQPKPSENDLTKAEVVWHHVTHWGLVLEQPGDILSAMIGVSTGSRWVPFDGPRRLDTIKHFIAVIGPDHKNADVLEKLDAEFERRRKLRKFARPFGGP